MTAVVAPEVRLTAPTFALVEAQAVGAGSTYTYLEGRAVPYDDWQPVFGILPFVEAHRAGSFAQSTKAGSGRGLPLHLFHDNRSYAIGKAESWTHDGGLDGVWKLADTREAQDAAKQADDGFLNGMSIGFAPIRSEWTYVDDWNPDLGAAHMDRVERLESRLLEVSLTTTPAFEAAQVSAVRTVYSAELRHAAAAAAGVAPRPLEVDTWRAYAEQVRSGLP